MKTYVIAGFLALTIVATTAPIARAEVSTATMSNDPAALLVLIQSLMKQVEQLQKQIAVIKAGITSDRGYSKERVEDKKIKVGDVKVVGVKTGTSTVVMAIDEAEKLIADLTKVTASTTNAKMAKKAKRYLADAKRKLIDAEEKMDRGNYRDALAKAVQAKRFAERGLTEVLGTKKISSDDKDDDKDEDEDEDEKDDDDR